MKYAVVIHGLFGTPRVIAPFDSDVLADEWARKHTAPGLIWVVVLVSPPS